MTLDPSPHQERRGTRRMMLGGLAQIEQTATPLELSDAQRQKIQSFFSNKKSFLFQQEIAAHEIML